MISQHNLLNHIAELVDNKVICATVNKQLSPINAEGPHLAGNRTSSWKGCFREF
ncbi:hypothetical protein MKY30_18720 [Oceanobacillus sp. FSL W8-0428]|uniref:hypothetical protein n=1 Tax=Oceanobacillus TaxID=182709 RepID=UPI0030FCA3E9